ncbi:MAG TPA: M6 family metalloprotease domain-containing protein [Chthoniobacterales bacterium]|nr:M6 family metalloprotease domain-containing protein [Chthoniobacterales bacterium]
MRAAEPQAPGLNDGMIVPPDEYPLGTPLRAIRSGAAERAPLAGVVRVIVVLVNFPDKQMSHSAAHFNDLFFSQGVMPTKSVREYYKDVTHGIIDIQGQVVGPFTMPQTIAAYAHGAAGLGGVLPNARTMARDAVAAADPTVNFAPFDNDGNGFVDAFIVVHAGPGGEVTGNPGDIWSHKWVLDGGARTADGTKIFAYLTVPEDCKIGVCCHELGHLLFGFPDLYDTDNTSEGIGNFCLMAGGSWGGGGDTPVHPSAWCKANQGWASVMNVMANGAKNIEDVKTSHQVFRLWKDGASGSEYFLVENRERTGFDASLPGGGLLIWHIDDSQGGNTDENHYKVALIQADAKKDLEHNVNRGDAGDPYPGTANNTNFSNTSTPNSKSYSGQDTCVAVSAIGAPGPIITATLRVKCKVIKEITKDQKDTHKDIIKDKEGKELEKKDIKEIIKDQKDTHKDIIKDKEGKEFEKKDHKEIKEKDIVEKPVKEFEKPITDKSAAFDKGFDKQGEGGKLGELGSLSGGNEAVLTNLLTRIQAIEAALGTGGQAATAQPFIGRELRPDLTQGALLNEQDLARAQQEMEAGSAQAKRSYDTKVLER